MSLESIEVLYHKSIEHIYDLTKSLISMRLMMTFQFEVTVRLTYKSMRQKSSFFKPPNGVFLLNIYSLYFLFCKKEHNKLIICKEYE